MNKDKLRPDYRLLIRISVCQMAIGIWDEILGSTLQNVLVSGFGKSESFKGAFVAFTQLFTMFLLPVWGGLSDRCQSRSGRRKPFILAGGLLCAVALALSVPFLKKNNLPLFLICMCVCALGICITNPAATALVPDLTPKPLNSEAAVVNRLTCSLGGSWVILLILLFGSDFPTIYIIAACTILNTTLFHMFFVPEPKFLDKQKPLLEKYNTQTDSNTVSLRNLLHSLHPSQKKSFVFILSANFFAKLAYYAFSSAWLNYAVSEWNIPFAKTGILTVTVYIAGLVSLLLTAGIARKIGRKKTLLLAYACMLVGFTAGSLLHGLHIGSLLCVALIGIGWSMESVLPLPMLLELSGAGTVGIVTSVYTDSCKLGRVVGPFLMGMLLDRNPWKYRALFPVAALMTIPALLCPLGIHHGNVSWKNGQEVPENEQTV